MLRALDHLLEDLASPRRAIVRDDRIDRVEPLAGLGRVNVRAGAVGAAAFDSISHLVCDGTQVLTADEDLVFAGPAALAEQVRRKEIHPRELVELCLRRIDSIDAELNAFRTTMPEEALAAAEQVPPDGPLAGVPIAIKGDTPVAGQPTTRGSRTHGPPEAADAEVVRRLRAGGAIPIGITNVPELTIFPWTASDATGITRNPWNPERTPGGSSGGSAAAVAAGMVPCASGSDGGGSIRIPAACCGLVGMKPTRGRVSKMPEGEHWLGLSTYGPLARTVADSAAMLDAMHGTIAGDVHHAPPFEGSYLEAAGRAPGQLRIAISKKIPPGLIASLSADQRTAWEQTARLLTELGHTVGERDPVYGMVGMEFTQTWLRGIYEDTLQVPDRSKLERTTRRMASAGRVLVPGRRARRLRERRPRTSARILGLWDDFDVLLTPGLATTAIPAEGGYGRGAFGAFNTSARFTPWTPPFNVTGQPAVTLPAGLGADGLPLSVQLVGRMGAEDTLYRLAGQLEEARPWAGERPPLVRAD
jgi:amidase